MMIKQTSRCSFTRLLAGWLICLLVFGSGAETMLAVANYDCDNDGTAETTTPCGISTNAAVTVGPPGSISVTDDSNGSATVSWTASQHVASGSVAGYYVYYKLNTDGSYSSYATTTDTSKTISGLTNANYDFLVRTADNDGGLSRTDCSSCEQQNVAITGAVAPTNTSMTINDLSPTTDVVVSLSTYAVGATEMYVFGDVDETHATYGSNVKTWIPYASSATVALTDYDGVKDIDIKYRNASQTESGVITQQITLSLPSVNSSGSSGGGGGSYYGGSRSASSTSTTGDYLATQISTATTADTVSADTDAETTLSSSQTEVVYTVDLLQEKSVTSQAVTVTLDITDLNAESISDDRLIEVGYINDNKIWQSFTNIELNNNEINFAMEEDKTVIVRIVDAEILVKDSVKSIETNKPILLPKDSGVVPGDITLTSQDYSITVELSAGTQIRNSGDGQIYDGIIYAPQLVENPPVANNDGVDLKSAIIIGSSNSDITFDQPVKLTLPVPVGTVNPQVFYYNERIKDYVLVKDSITGEYGGTLSADGSTITIYIDHMTIYGVAGVKSREVQALLEAMSEGLSGGGGFGIGIFSDLTPNHWAHDAVADLWDSYILAGYPDGTFRPNAPINRAELVKIAVSAFGEKENLRFVATADSVIDSFIDVKSNSWYAPFVHEAKLSGFVDGYLDNTFRPGQSINRAEAIKILIQASGLSTNRIAGSFIDISPDDWFASYVALAQSYGIVRGYPIYQSPSETTLLTFEEDLGYGDSGPEIRKLQLALRILNFYPDELTGEFDKNTVHALYRYQIWKKITPDQSSEGDSYLGKHTRELLNTANVYAYTGPAGTVYEFHPAAEITRAEVAVVVANLLKIEPKDSVESVSLPHTSALAFVTLEEAENGRVDNTDDVFREMSMMPIAREKENKEINDLADLETVMLAIKELLGSTFLGFATTLKSFFNYFFGR